VSHEGHDVAIIGAGIAGLAASVLLRNAGLRVVCLDAHKYPQRKVGESLDWSSPGLLRRVGIDTDALIADNIATYKKKIVVCELGKTEWRAAPPPVIRRSPLRFETVTLHVDRAALDARLFDHACTLGAEFIWERVTDIHTDGNRIAGCTTAGGRRVEARWYIDASGTARMLSRALNIPTIAYGQQKVCLWTYFDTPPLNDGTAFFVDNGDRYLRWVWDIPISPRQTSVGVVLSADVVRGRRQAGSSVEAILRDELLRHERFHALLAPHPVLEIESASFQPYVTTRVCGDSDAILAAGSGDVIAARRRRTYSQHVFRLGHSFNAHVESTCLQSAVSRCTSVDRWMDAGCANGTLGSRPLTRRGVTVRRRARWLRVQPAGRAAAGDAKRASAQHRGCISPGR